MSRFLLGFIVVFLLQGCEEYATETVKQEDVLIIVSASGELESKQQAMVAPPSISRMWQYQIQTMVPENSQVEKGQEIITFDNKPVLDRFVEEQGKLKRAEKELENQILKEVATEQERILAVAEMKMEYEKAQRKAEIVDQSRSENDRQKAVITFELAKNNRFLANKRLEFHRQSKELNINLAKAKVERLKNRVNRLQRDMDRLKVKAPISGMVMYKANWEGEKPAIGESIQFGQPVMELSVVESMQVKAQVAEPDSGKVAIGQHVKIIVDGTQEHIYSGKISSLGSVFRDMSSKDKRRIFDAIIELDRIDPAIMRPGMTARVEIVVGELSNQLTLPLAAITNNGNQVVVNVGGSEQSIEVSHISAGKVVIASGLEVGDEVRL